MSDGLNTLTAIRLLVLGNSRDQTGVIEKSLRNRGLAVHCAQAFDMEALEGKLNSQTFDVLLCYAFDDKINIYTTLEIINDKALDIPTLVLFGKGFPRPELMQLLYSGVRDIVEKDDLEHLQLVIAREVGDLERRRELKIVKHRLVASEQRCLELVEGSNEAIAFFQDGMHVHANPAYLQLFGFKNQEDMEVVTLLDMVEKSQHKALRATIKNLDSGLEQQATMDIRCYHQDGSVLDLIILITKVEMEGEAGLQITVRNRFPNLSLKTPDVPTTKMASPVLFPPQEQPLQLPNEDQYESVDDLLEAYGLGGMPDIPVIPVVPALPVTPSQKAETQPTIDSSQEDNKNILLIDNCLAKNDFVLFYNAIINLHGSGTKENYTISVRLKDDYNRNIPLESVIDIAIKHNKIIEIERWVIKRAIAELSAQRQDGYRSGFFITLSEASILNKNLLLWIVDYLREYDARGSWVTFQIKEKHARNNIQAVSKLIESLKTIRCRIAIDQFGLMSNNEGLLNQIETDYVKLDASFIENIHIDPKKQEELFQMNQILMRHNISTIVTKVQDMNSLPIIWNLGIAYIEGPFAHEPTSSIKIS
ncbi:hypothetical protein TI04_03665 [Achromatium sp. WMS2]|nr:hypothetical protein TI04_03665 [Achromatium sp. WMS2]